MCCSALTYPCKARVLLDIDVFEVPHIVLLHVFGQILPRGRVPNQQHRANAIKTSKHTHTNTHTHTHTRVYKYVRHTTPGKLVMECIASGLTVVGDHYKGKATASIHTTKVHREIEHSQYRSFPPSLPNEQHPCGCMHTHAYTYIHINIRTYVQSYTTRTYRHTHTHIYIHTPSNCTHPLDQRTLLDQSAP